MQDIKKISKKKKIAQQPQALAVNAVEIKKKVASNRVSGENRAKLNNNKSQAKQTLQTAAISPSRKQQVASPSKTNLSNLLNKFNNSDEKKSLNMDLRNRRVQSVRIDESKTSQKSRNNNTTFTSRDDTKDAYATITQTSGILGESYTDRRSREEASRNSEKGLIQRVKEKQEEIMQQIDNIENYLSLSQVVKEKKKVKKVKKIKKKTSQTQASIEEISKKSQDDSKVKCCETQTELAIQVSETFATFPDLQPSFGVCSVEIESPKLGSEIAREESVFSPFGSWKMEGEHKLYANAQATMNSSVESSDIGTKRNETKRQHRSKFKVDGESEKPSFSKYQSPRERDQTRDQDTSRVNSKSNDPKSRGKKLREDEIPWFSQYHAKR